MPSMSSSAPEFVVLEMGNRNTSVITVQKYQRVAFNQFPNPSREFYYHERPSICFITGGKDHWMHSTWGDVL